MNDSLDRFVDNYFEMTMDILERLERDENANGQQIHQALLGQLQSGEDVIRPREDWEQATYALAAWTDELMLELPWPGRHWWRDHVLESSLFGTRLCSERFFTIAKSTMRDRPRVLRVYHDCVLLGFRGFYALESSAPVASELGIPATLEAWLREAQECLRDDHSEAVPAKLLVPLQGAAPMRGRRDTVWWSVAAGTLLALNVTVYALLVR